MRAHLRYGLPPVLCMAAIFVASSHSNVPGLPVSGGDKLLHFCVYLVLGALWARALAGYGVALAKALLLGALVTCAYGVFDEVHQWFTPGRSAELADAVADALGGAVGAGLWSTVAGLRRRTHGS